MLCQLFKYSWSVPQAEKPPFSLALPLLEFRQHFFSNEAMAGIDEVIAVVGQDAPGLVFRVVLLPVSHESLAEVVERNLFLQGDLAGGLGKDL